MGTAALIRSYRVRAGKSSEEVAKHLGINDAWYQDLESSDDELANTLTLFQAMELASLLGVGLRDLLTEEPLTDESIPLVDVPPLIKADVARRRVSIEELEEELGWELHDFLHSPIQAAAESPIMFLQAIAEHLGINWLALVPDDQEHDV